jgi:hypothetical protein
LFHLRDLGLLSRRLGASLLKLLPLLFIGALRYGTRPTSTR